MIDEYTCIRFWAEYKRRSGRVYDVPWVRLDEENKMAVKLFIEIARDLNEKLLD